MSQTVGQPIVQVDAISLVLEKRTILEHVSLTLQAGQIVSLVGPNGAGKTTLVKIVVGLISPTAGTVVRAKALRIGYMPQQVKIDPLFPLTVERFLQLGFTGKSQTYKSALTEVGVASLLCTPMSALSGGEMQRVLLARALLRDPELLVLDEPAQGVDLKGQSEFYNLIVEIRNRHQCGVLLVSHDLNVVMAQADMVICLNRHVCCFGHPAKVTQDPAFVDLFGAHIPHLAWYTHRHDHWHPVGAEQASQKKEEPNQ